MSAHAASPSRRLDPAVAHRARVSARLPSDIIDCRYPLRDGELSSEATNSPTSSPFSRVDTERGVSLVTQDALRPL